MSSASQLEVAGTHDHLRRRDRSHLRSVSPSREPSVSAEPTLNHASFHSNAPCTHAGPCSPDTGCPCSMNNAHCTRTCRCSRECKCPSLVLCPSLRIHVVIGARRWQGCHCHSHLVKSYKKHRDKVVPACATDLCPCRKARRECDPDVCSPCGSKSCRNMQIQQRAAKVCALQSRCSIVCGFWSDGG